jgi:signal transduction histidine kinase
VVLTIQDTGPGIAAEHLPWIFNRFYRGEPSRQGDGESGLGLSIARSLTEVQGGTITVESDQGVGTTFSLTFPAGG